MADHSLKSLKVIALLVAAMLASNLASASASASDSASDSAPPKRIIALAPHIVENLFEIGAGDLIVGASSYADYPEQAKLIKEVGNHARLNIEEIMALQPDLIIAWQTGTPSDDLETLKKQGIRVAYSNPKTLQGLADTFEHLGQLTGREEQANKVAQGYRARLNSIADQYQDKAPITVFYELWSRPLSTVAGGAWPQQQLAICKADNPFKNNSPDYPQISVEQAVLSMPEIIVQPLSPNKRSPNSKAQFLNWQQWPQIPAVKNNAFIQPNADKIHRMTSRTLDALENLCAQIDSFRTNP